MVSNIYKYGENVTLTATPDTCCEFLYWVVSTEPCIPVSFEPTISVPANQDVMFIPVFRKKKYTVRVTPNLEDYCCITGNGEYECGERVEITITTAFCNHFAWADTALIENTEIVTGVLETTYTYVIENINEDFIQDVLIELCVCELRVETCQHENGSSSVLIVTSLNTPNHMTADYVCNGVESEPINPCDYTDIHTNEGYITVPCGTEVSLIATADSGSSFSGWIDGDVCNDCVTYDYVNENPVYTFILNRDRSLVACFS